MVDDDKEEIMLKWHPRLASIVAALALVAGALAAGYEVAASWARFGW